MAVVLRLRREGSKDHPHYKIVAADKRSRRDGRFIDILGTYDPMKEKDNCVLDLEKTDKWISQGAKPSETVASLIKKVKKQSE